LITSTALIAELDSLSGAVRATSPPGWQRTSKVPSKTAGALSLIDDAERLGPLVTAGVVVALLIGVGVFLYRMDPQARVFKPLRKLLDR